MRSSKRVVALVIAAWSFSGCFWVNGGSGLDDEAAAASVRIDDVSVSPSTVNDGETFTVSWSVTHTTDPGYFTQLGLYLGGAEGLEDTSERDSRSLLSAAATAGAPNDPSASSATCTRTGSNLKCDLGSGGSRQIAVGETQVTFRACNSYVLDESSEVCETRSLAMTFP